MVYYIIVYTVLLVQFPKNLFGPLHQQNQDPSPIDQSPSVVYQPRYGLLCQYIAMTAIHENVTFKSYKTYGSLIYVVLFVMQRN